MAPLVFSSPSLPWGGRVTYLIVNMKAITGYGRLKSDFIPLGSELSAGSMISLLLLSLQGKRLQPSAAKTR